MLLKDISFVIPVYNRPEEIDELLQSFSNLNGEKDFEIVVIDDGSIEKSENIILKYNHLNISYYFKNNTGPGDSRNFGMNKANGEYFILLDSDIILPENYTQILITNLHNNYADCFGGVDDHHHSFNLFQKAVSYSMTSFVTTGHIRGGNKSKNFQPRSFNMGISRIAFEESGGFGRIHPGEDPDLSIRLNKLGFSTKLYNKLSVYHKRRTSVNSFFNQVYKFGVARSILNKWHPHTKSLIYWFPAIFIITFTSSIALAMFSLKTPLLFFITYFSIIFIDSTLRNNPLVGVLSVFTSFIQFFGYGYGFVKSFLMLFVNRDKNVESIFPKMFFK